MSMSLYVPKIVLGTSAQELMPEKHELFEAVVMFLDISGFTPLSERLCRHGLFGVELLRNIISDFFSSVIPLLQDNGGDVIKFAGGNI